MRFLKQQNINKFRRTDSSVSTTIAGNVKLDPVGDAYIDVVYSKIKNLSSPVDLTDAANKNYVDSSTEVDNVIFVSMDGNDANDGTTLAKPKRTIKSALTIATRGTTIKVQSGDYTENNPLTVPAFVSIVGDSLRTVTVRPLNKTQDLFYVTNGCYLTQMTFKDHLSPGAAVAFPPSGAGKISTSPYVQNCTSMTSTGTGLRIDGNHAGGLRSFVVDAYTQYNQGGIGIHHLNGGNSQLVSVFTICCDKAVLSESGGFCTLANSNSSFGNFGLVADGVSPVLYSGKVVSNNRRTVTIKNLVQKPNVGNAVNIDSFAGTTLIVQPDFTTEDISLQNAQQTLLNSRDIIAAKTLFFIEETYPTFEYNSEICFRDVKLIIEAVADDMVFGTNYFSIISGIAYYRQSANSVLTDQKTETLAALNFVKTESLALITGNVTATTRVTNNFNTVIDIIDNGLTSVPVLTLPNPTGVTTNIQNAVANLDANRTYIKAEITAFIANQYPDLVYNVSKCERDVDYIIDAFRYDLLYGGNSATADAAKAYYSFGSLQINSEQKDATVASFTYLRDLVMKIVVDNTSGTRYQNLIPQVTGINASTVAESEQLKILGDLILNVFATDDINYFTVRSTGELKLGNIHIEQPNFSTEALDLQEALAALMAEREVISSKTIFFLTDTYPTFQYNQFKCARDVNIIVEAVAEDMVFGSNYQTILSAVSYYRQTANKVIDEQKLETIAALEFVRDRMLEVVTGNATAITRINNSFDIIVDILENGIGVAPALLLPSPTGVSSNIENAVANILLNKNYVKAEAIAYISANYPSLVYNTSACERDIEFILNAIAYDLLYGGNSEIANAADEYFSGGYIQIDIYDKLASIAVYGYIKELLEYIVVNDTTSGTRYQAIVIQDTSTPAATSSEVIRVGNLATVVVTLLTDGYTCDVTLEQRLRFTLPAGTDVTFHQYSNITSTGHQMDWVGTGTNINTALPYVGGVPQQENEVVELRGGKVNFTSTDQRGDFRIGEELVINRITGTISGRTFSKSLFAELTPFILAIEG
jgi:hypothetical protein